MFLITHCITMIYVMHVMLAEPAVQHHHMIHVSLFSYAVAYGLTWVLRETLRLLGRGLRLVTWGIKQCTGHQRRV